ncbi:glycosyl transferase [Cytophagales bacterium WSM2-2]|nr:glycosyl transferase [Cytophagales bacterium WSM2-2]
MPAVSIVIPCFNHGKFLPEAIESVKPLKENDTAEIIIVNDGSTDKQTLEILEKLAANGWKIIHQQNLGLAEARNNGIRHSSGLYILPLDSDNICIPSFVNDAIRILERHPDIDIVYSDCEFFGEKNYYKKVGEFDPCKLINDNFIDACAIYRKKIWEELKGYNKNIPHMGHEDWDFWIGALMLNKRFHYEAICGFKYRVRQNSMLDKLTDEKGEENRQYIYSKYNFQLLNSIRMNYNGDTEKYKERYFKQIESLNERRLKNIAKLLIGKKFG